METLARLVGGSSEWRGELAGHREARVTLFERVCGRLIGMEQSGVVDDGMILGALLSTIGPGSMEYLGLALERAREFPGIVLWYGLFAGAAPESNVLSEFDAFGRRLARDLLHRDGAFDRPRCDLSLPELEVLLRGARMPTGWRVANPGGLSVEIEPTIYVTFPWPFAHALDRSPREERDAYVPSEEQLFLPSERSPGGNQPTSGNLPSDAAIKRRRSRRRKGGAGR